jgi:hypothetical protein
MSSVYKVECCSFMSMYLLLSDSLRYDLDCAPVLGDGNVPAAL